MQTEYVCIFFCAEERVVKYGDTVTLRCKAVSNIDVKWTQTDTRSHIYPIFTDGTIFGNIRNRFSRISTEPGEYNLRMIRANPSDAGLYVCDELSETSGSRTVLSQYNLTIPGKLSLHFFALPYSANSVGWCSVVVHYHNNLVAISGD